MAVANDGSTVQTANFTAASNVSFTHTVGAGSNLCAAVAIGCKGGNAASYSATYGGAAMTKNSNSNSAVHGFIFSKAAPATGSQTASVTLSNATGAGACMSYSGVDQTTPVRTTTTAASSSGAGAGNNGTVTGSRNANELQVDAICVDNSSAGSIVPSLTQGANQTLLLNDGANMVAGGSSEKTTSTAVMGWSWISDGAVDWSHIIATLQPPVATVKQVFKLIPQAVKRASYW